MSDNEPSEAMLKATDILNRWIARCAIEALEVTERSKVLIQMIADALEENSG